MHSLCFLLNCFEGRSILTIRTFVSTARTFTHHRSAIIRFSKPKSTLSISIFLFYFFFLFFFLFFLFFFFFFCWRKIYGIDVVLRLTS